MAQTKLPLKRTLVCDTEDGTITIRDRIRNEWRTDPITGKRDVTIYNPEGMVDVEHTPTLDLLDKAYWRIREGKYPDKHDVVTIDTITTLSVSHRHLVLMNRRNIGEKEVMKNYLKLTPEYKDWGVTSDNIIMILRQFRGLPCLTLFLTHDRKNEDEFTKEKTVGPALNAQLLGDMLNNTDDAFRITNSEKIIKIDNKTYPAKTRFLRIAQSDTYQTKVRMGFNQQFPDYIVNPDLWKILEIKGIYFCRRLVVFGPRGAGKTLFGTSFSFPRLPDIKPIVVSSSQAKKEEEA